MLYHGYQAYADATDPIRALARTAASALRRPAERSSSSARLRELVALSEVVALAGLTHERPAFGFDTVQVGGRDVAVREEIVQRTPFCSLVRFRKNADVVQPRMLVVAPLSGHFATLLRGTVRTLLCDHDVYLTDWRNVRDVPLADGPFDLGVFIEHVMRFLRSIGPRAHVLAVCQPTVPVLAAVALLAAADDRGQPASMTLMAGPIDTRVNPTRVNELANSRPIEWFERNLIGTVPLRYPGALRRGYPGFVQIASFMSMNPDRHRKAFDDLYRHLANGDFELAEPILQFYHEYFATMDLPAEFYLQTVRAIFQTHLLPLGKLFFRSQRVEPQAIRRTSLLTIEGEKDDICSVGQTLAAHDLCSALRPYMKQHHVQTSVGHYGVFNGRRWERQVYPIVRDFVYTTR